MKKIKLFSAILSLIVLTACFNIKPVEFKNISNASVSLVGIAGAQLKFNVNLHNPNNFKINLYKSNLNIKLDEIDFGDTQLDSTIFIPPNSDITIPLTLNTKFQNIFSGVLQTLTNMSKNSNEIPLKIKGYVTVKAKGIKTRIPVNRTENIKLQ